MYQGAAYAVQVEDQIGPLKVQSKLTMSWRVRRSSSMRQNRPRCHADHRLESTALFYWYWRWHARYDGEPQSWKIGAPARSGTSRQRRAL